MDPYKVTGMFLQALGGFLLILMAGLITLSLQLGLGFTLADALTLAFAFGAIWLGRVTEKWGQRG